MASHPSPDQPSRWVSRFAGLIPLSGLVLDLACGGGRHARHLASLGHRVLAVDRDPGVLSLAADQIEVLCLDLEADDSPALPDWPLQPGRFAGIVVTNYLHRPLMADLFSSLAPGGVLIYETFAKDNGLFGKPSNPDFLLAAGELLSLSAADPGLRVLAFEDGYVSQPKPAMVQRICVMREAAALPPQARLIDPS